MSQLLRAITLASAAVVCASQSALRAQETPPTGAAPASAPASPFPVTRHLQGRLSGAFAPERFDYEVTFTKVTMVQAGPGEHTTSITMTSDSDASRPVKVGSDGRFDLGTVTINEHDSLTVVAVLRGGEKTDRSTVFDSMFLNPSSAKGWRGPFPPLDPATETLDLALPAMSTVVLSTDEALTTGKRVTFTVWDERGGMATSYGKTGHCTLLKEAGSYLVQATLGDLASPLTAVVVGSDGSPVSAELPLLECRPFRVQLTGGAVAKGGMLSFVIGTDSIAKTPLPCRVRLMCRDGVVELKNILPGTYVVELQSGLTPVHHQQMELRPDTPPIALSED